MVQTTQVKFTDKTSALLERIKVDLTKLFGEDKIRIESVPAPVKYGNSIDIVYLHKNRSEKAWFSLFFTITLPKKQG
jgi:hypothetical protein